MVTFLRFIVNAPLLYHWFIFIFAILVMFIVDINSLSSSKEINNWKFCWYMMWIYALANFVISLFFFGLGYLWSILGKDKLNKLSDVLNFFCIQPMYIYILLLIIVLVLVPNYFLLFMKKEEEKKRLGSCIILSIIIGIVSWIILITFDLYSDNMIPKYTETYQIYNSIKMSSVSDIVYSAFKLGKEWYILMGLILLVFSLAKFRQTYKFFSGSYKYVMLGVNIVLSAICIVIASSVLSTFVDLGIHSQSKVPAAISNLIAATEDKIDELEELKATLEHNISELDKKKELYLTGKLISAYNHAATLTLKYSQRVSRLESIIMNLMDKLEIVRIEAEYGNIPQIKSIGELNHLLQDATSVLKDTNNEIMKR